ncbi:MAG: sigma 54-interacting transcriptional regulator [Treponemataceae bacterium]
MIRILLIAPYQEFASTFKLIFDEHTAANERADYENENYELSSVIATGTHELQSLNFEAEVVVSRGFISSELRHLKFYVPVIEVPVASVDLVHSLHKAIKEFQCDRVAVVGALNMVMGVERLTDIMPVKIYPYQLASQGEIRDAVDEIIAAGIPVIIGGVKTCAYAKERGLKTVLLESGRESIWHSITEAKRLAYLVRQERERTQHLSALVNQAQEGIITLDAEGKICLFNKASSEIFGIYPSNAIGKPLGQVIPPFSGLVWSSTAAKDEIVKCGDKMVSAGFSGLSRQGELNGTLIMVQDVTRVQELETRIRERVYSRGHVAHHTFEDIIGDSLRIKETVVRAKKFSQVDSNILIYGKTGTGKELFAQSIHNAGRRRTGPFVAVNCAALSESLLESELFGYVEGAFTGASKGGKPGLFELAHHGSLFLDEISEIPMQLQGRLLRAIQEKEIMRLGHDRVIPVDVRIIAATNCSLSDLVASGSFREDLFYRLNILRLELPSLSERTEDIPALVEHWISAYSTQFGYPKLKITEKAKTLLKSVFWPGNIRQLRNHCERMVVLSQCDVIDARDVELVMETEPQKTDPNVEFPDSKMALITSALQVTGNNKLQAARNLGISRTTLWRRLKQLKQS